MIVPYGQKQYIALEKNTTAAAHNQTMITCQNSYFWSMSMKLRSILFLVQNKDVFNLISNMDEETVSSGVQIINRPYSRLSLSGRVSSRNRPLHLNGLKIKQFKKIF